MPSIMTLEGPSLHGRSLVSGTFRPQILSTSPALGFASFTASAANFWLGAGLGVIGTIAAQRVMSGKPLWNKKSSSDVSGARRRRRR
jgi:hypothetical protein